MYCYIDEQLDQPNNPYFTFVALVIENQRSKRAISQAVARAVIEIRKREKNPNKRIPELKAQKHLRKYPQACIRLLKRMQRKAGFRLYILRYRKREPTQPLPKDPDRTYNSILSNILPYIRISGGLRLLTVVMDTRADATPVSKNDGARRYWRTRKKEHKRREKDAKRRKKLAQMITDVFKKEMRRSERTLIKVRALHSHQDRCLQAVDLMTYLYGRKRYLEDKLTQSLNSAEHGKKQQEHHELQKAYQIIEQNIAVQRDPLYYLQRPKEKLKRTA